MSANDFDITLIECTRTLKPFAIRLTRSADEAEDLLQEMAYRALKSRDKFAENTNLPAWLFTIMKNIFINNYRRSKRMEEVVEMNDFENIKMIYGASKNDGESGVEMSYLNKEMEKLSITYRKPFMMYYDGYKYHEIAHSMKLPLGTVKSRIHIARKEMQKRLRDRTVNYTTNN